MEKIRNFAHGFHSIKKGFSFLKNNKKLWVYAVIPTIINVFLLILSFYFIFHYFPDVFGWILNKIGFFEINSESIWHKILIPIIWIVKAVLFIFFFLFAMILCFIVGLIISGPFNDLLSEKTEKILSPNERVQESSFASMMTRTVVVETKKAIVFIIFPLALLFLNIIPIVGTIAYVVIVNLFAIFELGLSFLDYPMGRRNWTFAERFKFGWKNKFTVCGLGIIFLIPFLPYLINASLVVSGTIIFRELNTARSVAK